MTNNLTIGYTCNVRPPELDGDPKYGEWESHETIEAITTAFEKTGNKVVLIDVDKDVYHKLLRYDKELDIIFNNAEGLEEVKIRESIVPFFCDVLNIPYSGSGPDTLANALDKPTTKEILAYYGINTPLFQEMDHYADRLEEKLQFPLMVKPISEGTSIGITQKSKVENNEELVRAVKRVISSYRQPALIEEFVDGDEYTVGIIGDYIFPILKVPFGDLPDNPVIRDPHVKDIETPFMTVMSYNEEGYLDLARQTAISFEALSCNDYCRMDFRKGKDGKFYFLEMNPLPGVHPVEADLTNMARHAGLTHEEMMNMILWEAIKRNRNDERYSDRFTEDKVVGVRDLAVKAKGKLSFYGEKISANNNGKNSTSYRLVKVN